MREARDNSSSWMGKFRLRIRIEAWHPYRSLQENSPHLLAGIEGTILAR